MLRTLLGIQPPSFCGSDYFCRQVLCIRPPCPRESQSRIRSSDGAVVLQQAGIVSTGSLDSALAQRVGTSAIQPGNELLGRPSWRKGSADCKAAHREAMMACALSGLLYFLCHVRGLSLQLDSSLGKLAAEQLPSFSILCSQSMHFLAASRGRKATIIFSVLIGWYFLVASATG